MDLELQQREQYIVDILKREGNTVLRLAFSYLKNMSEAEDVYQEVFIKLLEDNYAFDCQEHEKAWLIRVTINLCKNRLRSFWRNKVDTLEDNVLSKYEDITGRMDVFNAVMSLKLKHRTVIHLYYYEGCTTSEISMLTGWSESAVRTSLHRARKILSDSLEGVVIND